jgi:hypothetical protein
MTMFCLLGECYATIKFYIISRWVSLAGYKLAYCMTAGSRRGDICDILRERGLVFVSTIVLNEPAIGTL